MTARPSMPSAPVMQALQRLLAIVLQLRSPMGGWPADLEQTPENLAPYVSEEIWEFLDALDHAVADPVAGPQPPELVMAPIPALIPHLLWLLASSHYEVMRLLEGVRSRLYWSDSQYSLEIVRLVPVLSLTVGERCYGLDLVTQAEPDTTLFLSDPMSIKLMENDLDNQPRGILQMLDQLRWGVGQTKPQLSLLLESGWPTQALSPFQPWATGTLQLQLYLAKMEERQLPVAHGPLGTAGGDLSRAAYPGENGHHSEPSAPGYTLDDFAESLEQAPQMATSGILGDWLTFTHDAWVQTLVNSCAQEILLQHLHSLTTGRAIPAGQRELACMELVYTATTLAQGDHPLATHRFVHEPALVADVWPRLRWYLAHCSERVMQLMGGLSTRVLMPGRGWQRGYLYLRPIMTLAGQKTDSTSDLDQPPWMLDLGSGRVVPTHPLTLPEDAVVAFIDNRTWLSPFTIRELKLLIDQDFEDYAPAMVALSQQGTSVNLHRLESEAGRQAGRLILNWGFTLQAVL